MSSVNFLKDNCVCMCMPESYFLRKNKTDKFVKMPKGRNPH